MLHPVITALSNHYSNLNKFDHFENCGQADHFEKKRIYPRISADGYDSKVGRIQTDTDIDPTDISGYG